MNQPLLGIMHCLTVDANGALPLPLTALVFGVLTRVEATIELTDRICDKYSRNPNCARSSAA